MGYVFGSTLVVDTDEDAKAVTFHPSVRTKCVTLDGDKFDPAGTVSGGSSAGRGNSILDALAKLAEAESAYADAVDNVERANADLENARQIAVDAEELEAE